MSYLPRGEYRPTLEEIAAVCRSIRDDGFYDHRDVWHSPWTEAEYHDRAGVQVAHVEFPFARAADLFGQADTK
jgi:hypothetical protein